MTEGTPPERGDKSPARLPRPAAGSGSEFAGVGLQFGFSIVLFAFAGYWLDKKLGTSPWLLILLVFVGAAAAFYSMYRRLFPPKPPSPPTSRTPPGAPGP